ncbi:MAG: hypothetical protein ACRDPC_20940 [Solirubrobacteraceae bacterium]
MIGRVYLDPGRRTYRRCPCRPARLARVVVRWQGSGPRNVLVEPVDAGPPYLRPFSGLRRAT